MKNLIRNRSVLMVLSLPMVIALGEMQGIAQEVTQAQDAPEPSTPAAQIPAADLSSSAPPAQITLADVQSYAGERYEELPEELRSAIQNQFPRMVDIEYRRQFVQMNEELILELLQIWRENPARLQEIARHPMRHDSRSQIVNWVLRLDPPPNPFRPTREFHVGVQPALTTGTRPIGYNTRVQIALERQRTPSRGYRLGMGAAFGSTSSRTRTAVPQANGEFRLQIPSDRLRRLSVTLETTGRRHGLEGVRLQPFVAALGDRNISLEMPWRVEVVGGVAGRVIHSPANRSHRTRTLDLEVRTEAAVQNSFNRTLPWVGAALEARYQDCRRTRLGEGEEAWEFCARASIEATLAAVHVQAGAEAAIALSREFNRGRLDLLLGARAEGQSDLSGSAGSASAGLGLEFHSHRPPSPRREQPARTDSGTETHPDEVDVAPPSSGAAVETVPASSPIEEEVTPPQEATETTAAAAN